MFFLKSKRYNINVLSNKKISNYLLLNNLTFFV